MNNSLRIGTPDTILYCRLALKDLEKAIKEEPQTYNGLLYRGCIIPEEEWIKLRENTKKDIEMYGFLSTSKDIEVAQAFSGGENSVLITIIVPPDSSKGSSGFIEMEKYSGIPEEKEVLFNIRSRFTVLEATKDMVDGKKSRHLVLLYGGQNIRKLMKINNLKNEIQMDLAKFFKCHLCQKEKEILKDSPCLYFKLVTSSPLICADCMNRYQPKQTKRTQNKVCQGCEYQFKSDNECVSKKGSFFCVNCMDKVKSIIEAPLLCFPAVSLTNKLKIEFYGRFLVYQQDLDIPFYGYECRSCKNNRLVNCYKCITCQEQDRTWCQKCFDQNNACLDQQHRIVLENQPFSCWNQAMSDDEINHLKYHEEVMDLSKNKFQQGLLFMYTENYERAVKYYLTYLDKKALVQKEKIILYWNLGEGYLSLGNNQEAMGLFKQALKIS